MKHRKDTNMVKQVLIERFKVDTPSNNFTNFRLLRFSIFLQDLKNKFVVAIIRYNKIFKIFTKSIVKKHLKYITSTFVWEIMNYRKIICLKTYRKHCL